MNEDQSFYREKQQNNIASAQKNRADANNANAVRTAADLADKSGHPVAKPIGKAVKIADGLSGGKASEKLGKALTAANKMNGLKGKMAQSAINKASESGTTDRISKAVNSRNNTPNNSSTKPNVNNSLVSGRNSRGLGAGLFSNFFGSSKKETEEQASDGGGANFRTSFKFIKIALIAMGPIFGIVVFCALIISASQIYINAIGLGNADSLSDADVESKINKKINNSEDINDEIKDDDIGYDYFIEDNYSSSFKANKLSEYNLVPIAATKYLKRKYNEASLDELQDFYPVIGMYSDKYDENTVYDFFFKLYYVYQSYRDDYNVYLDLPLLMATLDKQSSDKGIVFSSNLSSEDKKKTKRSKSDFDYCKDWSGYITTKDNSEHDIEVLAQHMVSEQVTEYCEDSSGKRTQEHILKDAEIDNPTLTCADGETYRTTTPEMKDDEEKYKEFLKEFLEKKYYLKEKKALSSSHYSNCGVNTKVSSSGSYTNPSSSSEGPTISGSSSGNSFAAAMINLANSELISNNGAKGGQKYINAFGGFGPGTPWCAIFVWYISSNTRVNGQSLYPDIIPYKTASVNSYIRSFNSSDKSNIKFYYNDKCSKLKGKNGNISYTPKPGDYIFFDWQSSYNMSAQNADHVGIVEKYESGIIYTIEGNSSNTVSKRKYSIDSCKVAGFGSWY